MRPWLRPALALALAAPLCALQSGAEFKSVLPIDAKTCSATDANDPEKPPVPCAWVRETPQPTGPALWKMWKFSPVEIVSYRGEWARVRDFEGDEGWIQRALLSDTPTVCVRLKEGKVRLKPDIKGRIDWILDKGYPLRIFGEKGEWYEVSDLEDVSGWIHRGSVWGAPPPPRPKR